MKKYTFILVLLPLFLSAQNFNTLNERAFGGSSWDVLQVIPVGDGSGYFYYGSSASSGSMDHASTSYGGSDVWVIRTDLNHTILWEISYGGTGTDTGLDAEVIGNYLFIAATSDSPISGNKTVDTYGGKDIWILKLDFNGNILWQNTYGGIDIEFDVEIVQYSNQLLFHASTTSSNSGNITLINKGSLDCWVALLDTLNGSINNQTMIGSSSTDKMGSLEVIDNRIFLITNSDGSDGDIPTMDAGSEDIVLFELNNNLDIIQTKGYWGSSTDRGRRLIKKSANEYFLFAYSSSSISGTKTSNSFGSYDIWLLKLDANFDVIWDTIYGGTNYERTSKAAHIDDNGNLVLLTTSSSITGSGNKTSTFYGFDDLWLLVINSNTGNLITDYSFGGGNYDNPTGMIPLGNGNLLLCGASDSGVSGNRTVSLKGIQDTWILEVDGSNYLNINENEAQKPYRFYPNPFSDKVILSLEPDLQLSKVSFYTVDGRELYTENLPKGQKEVTFDFKAYQGVIFYTLLGTNVSYSGKLIKTK